MRGFQFFGIACTRRSAGRRDPMNRHAYLARPDIRAFVNWTTDFVIGERKLFHSWESRPPNPLSFSCQSLWDAYEGGVIEGSGRQPFLDNGPLGES